MSSALSAQHWVTSHPNVPTRKVIKQSPLEDKEAYLIEGALVANKKATIQLSIQKKKLRSKFVKTGPPGLANRSIRFQQKISEL
jgi:hypothetical protein